MWVHIWTCMDMQSMIKCVTLFFRTRRKTKICRRIKFISQQESEPFGPMMLRKSRRAATLIILISIQVSRALNRKLASAWSAEDPGWFRSRKSRCSDARRRWADLTGVNRDSSLTDPDAHRWIADRFDRCLFGLSEKFTGSQWGSSFPDRFTQRKEKVSLQRSAEYRRRGQIHPTPARAERSYL